MENSIYDQILKDREWKNEKTVGLIRLIFLTIIVLMDSLSYFEYIRYGLNRPTSTTLFLDCSFLILAITIVYLLSKIHFDFLKYVIITLDCILLAMFIAFDPTVPKDSQMLPWVALGTSLFLFFLNLLRYSKNGTLYAGILALMLFIIVSTNFLNQIGHDFFPMMVSLLMFLAIGYIVSASYKKMMIEAGTKKMMERYLPPQLIRELYLNTSKLNPAGSLQEVTIVFTDIRSFTSMAEGMNASEVVKILNEYLSQMTDVIFANEGTIDKFIGDSIMTVFGAPIQRKDDPIRAVKTAVEMLKAMDAVNQKFKLSKPLEIGIGIHTGEVVAGNIGSDKRMDYTVIGDTVNLASRIEGLTKYYQCPILISETTMKMIPESAFKSELLFREIDTVAVKGRISSIVIYEVIL